MPELSCIIGWDVGGAHLKMAAVDASGGVRFVGQWPTPLWQGIASLERAITQANTHINSHTERMDIITMTGELVDGFRNRKEGVTAISHCLSTLLNPVNLRFYAGPNGFLPPADCVAGYESIASANWYATSSYVATRFDRGVLFDVGSTTADIIPFASGKVLARGYTDHERLLQQELCYSGVVRTPVMAIVDRLPWGDGWCPVMNEQFANLADVHRITGDLPEGADLGTTCDGGDKDTAGSVLRLARMIGIDADTGQTHESGVWQEIAAWISRQQQQSLGDSLAHILKQHGWTASRDAEVNIIGAGCGRFLVRSIADELQLTYVDIESVLDTSPEYKRIAADCAAAVSVAQLMRIKV